MVFLKSVMYMTCTESYNYFCVCVSWFLATKVTLTTDPIIDETAGNLTVTLNLDKPSPCCLHVYVEAADKNATGKLLVL